LCHDLQANATEPLLTGPFDPWTSHIGWGLVLVRERTV